jgi:hypothetical protein
VAEKLPAAPGISTVEARFGEADGAHGELNPNAGHHTMQAVVIRLRCALPSCRQAPSIVKLIGQSDGRRGRPKQEVTLVGPEAY